MEGRKSMGRGGVKQGERKSVAVGGGRVRDSWEGLLGLMEEECSDMRLRRRLNDGGEST